MTKREKFRLREQTKRQYQFEVKPIERPYIWDVMERLQAQNIECFLMIREDMNTVLFINVYDEEHSINHNKGFLLGYLLGVLMMNCAQHHETSAKGIS